MNIIEHPQPHAQAPTRGMLLHCGAQTVSREDLLAVPTPRGTRTWYPLSHSTILGEVETQLESSGFTIIEETHALSHEGARYFGVITPAQIPDVLMQWRKPEHESFEPRNAWSLFNAFTEVHKAINPHTALRRGEALHGLFDAEVACRLIQLGYKQGGTAGFGLRRMLVDQTGAHKGTLKLGEHKTTGSSYPAASASPMRKCSPFSARFWPDTAAFPAISSTNTRTRHRAPPTAAGSAA